MKKFISSAFVLFFAIAVNAALILPDNENDTIYAGQNLNEEVMFFIPNAFTPNGDGKNDYFIPYGAGITIESFEMRIYDRRGQVVYVSYDLNHPWDGNVEGKRYDETSTDVFAYHIIVYTDRGFKNEFFGKVLRMP